MQDSNNENTVPNKPYRKDGETAPTNLRQNKPLEGPSLEVTQVSHAPVQTSGRPRRWPWILLGLVVVLLAGGTGTWLGYNSAIDMRQQVMEESLVTQATEHFMMGLQAQQNKQYEIARQQFEYVIRLDPNFPGAADKLREVLTAQMVKETPTPVIPTETPTLTPTKDMRPLDDIFNQARQHYINQDWDNFFATIDALRATDPKYRAIEVDGMLYFALRFRGIDKILHKANLEGGIYDLALAEQFGPLDVDATGYRNWARLYLRGASFWKIDWVKVMEYFEEIYPYFPNLMDGSGLTAVERYRIAARMQGDKLVADGDYCGAMEFYKKSLDAVPDGALASSATAVFDMCYPATATPDVTITPTVTPTIPVPVDVTPTPTPTATTESAPIDVTPTVTETQASSGG